MTSRAYDAVLFDLDGTVLDTLSDLVELTNTVLTHFGYPNHSREEVLSYVGAGARVLLTRALPAGSTDEAIDEALAYWKELYPEYGHRNTAPYAGMPEALAQLKTQGVKLGVLSNKFDAAAREVVERCYPGVFDMVRGECEEFPRKPDPTGMLKMLAALGTAPEHAAYVGDSGSDMDAAHNAGTLAVGVSWGYQSVEVLAEHGAHAIIETPRDLIALVNPDTKGAEMPTIEEKLALWIEKVSDEELAAELAKLAEGNDEAAVKDAFFQDLAFGTAGLRGILGAGTNRMNIYTVGRASQGFADYLNAHFDNPSVAIGRDSRNKGELFMRRAAEVFVANGVKVYLYPRVEPVPALSWAVRDLGASGGVCITASHNPAPYNGYKAYGSDGCQITTQASRDISDAIAKVDMFEGVSAMDFEEAQAAGLINWICEDTLDRYVDAVEACSYAAEAEGEVQPLKLVYTPLNGSGLELVSRILERVGITDVTVVPEQREPNGDFPTCPYPNPEIREAMERGIALSEEVHPDLLVATDPDADRVGIAVKDGDDYTLLTGNETGVLLLDYVARMRQARGESLADKIAVTTIVSSVMVDAIAAEYGFEVRRVLTGFKYIGEIIGELEAAGEADRFIFGFEESYGYLSGAHVRDKDAVNATMLICQMAQYYKQLGKNLAEAIRDLYERHGFYRNKTNSFSYPGADGAARMAEIMANVHAAEPAEIAGLAVEGKVDYQAGVNGLPAADVVEFDLAGSNKLIIRPSGTEPKIKAYVFATGATSAAAEELQVELEKAAEELLS